jgi:hypothetical protein
LPSTVRAQPLNPTDLSFVPPALAARYLAWRFVRTRQAIRPAAAGMNYEHGDRMADLPQPSPAPRAPSGRRRLANRRPHEVREIVFAGIRYRVGLGRFDDGEIAELFINVPGKVGTDLEAHARDAAIVASIAFQHGVGVDVLRQALTRTGNGCPGSVLSHVLDQIAAESGKAG